MMTIDEIKNEILENMKDFITTEVKDMAIKWIKDTALPAVKEVATAFVAELKNSAVDEKGWVKFRDTIFLPVAINGSLWIVEKVVNKLAPTEE